MLLIGTNRGSGKLGPMKGTMVQYDHIWRNFATLAKVYKSYFLPCKLLSPPCQKYDIFGLIFIAWNGLILKNNLTIWSQWFNRSTSLFIYSVTRFDEISPLWQHVESIRQYFHSLFNIWHILNLLWQKY